MKTSIYNVTEYGVTGDGKTNNTKKIALLIDTVEKNGGGTLYFPAGQYVTGTIMLKSSMTLELEAGCTILGSEDYNDYPMIDSTAVEGWHEPTHAGFVAALRAENIAVKGRGTLDGRGYNWWFKAGNERPRSIQFIDCKNVLIEGIRIINSPMWTVHPVCCDNVTVHGVSIKNPCNSPNTDGINPEGCSNVHISDCNIDVGDDCLTLKSGTQDDLFIKRHACENITVTNCTMVHGHGGVVIGSEMSGGVRNVTISNCVFCGTDRGIRIKTRRLRGGMVEDIRVNNVIMDGVFCPLVVNCFYRCGTKPEDLAIASSKEPQPVRDDTPVFRNLYFSNLTVRNAVAAACYMYGLPELPVDGITIDNFTVDMKQGDDVQPQAPAMTYDSPKMKGKGILIYNAKNVVMRNMKINAPNETGVTLENCEHISIDGLMMSSVSDKPVIDLKNANDVFVAAGRLREEAANLLRQDGCTGVCVK